MEQQRRVEMMRQQQMQQQRQAEMQQQQQQQQRQAELMRAQQLQQQQQMIGIPSHRHNELRQQRHTRKSETTSNSNKEVPASIKNT